MRKLLLISILCAAMVAWGVLCFAATVGMGRLGSSSVVGSPIRASYPSESFGGALADEANRDQNTVMYCRDDDLAAISNPNCGLSDARHVGVGLFSAGNYFIGSAAPVASEFVGYGCVVFRPTSIGAVQGLIGISGYDLRINVDGTMTLDGTSTAPGITVTTANAVVLRGVNLVCAGGEAGGAKNVSIQLNGGSYATHAGPGQIDDGTAYVGRSYTNDAFTGRIFEVSFSTTAASSALFSSIWTAASTCRVAGRCLSTDAGEAFYLNGDSYLVGGSWYGDAAHTAGNRFDLTGQLLAKPSRYNWPSLVWTHNGTVPRATQSNLYPEGYGAKHGGLSGFAASSKDLSLGSGAGVLDHADGTRCVLFTTGSDVTTGQMIASDQDGGGLHGWYFYLTGGVFKYLPGATEFSSALTVVPNTDYAWCAGSSGAASVMNVVGTASSSAQAGVAGSATAARIGVWSFDRSLPFLGAVREFWDSTTPATAAYVLGQVNAALACAHPGPCIPDDANTVCHCFATPGGGWECPTKCGVDWTRNGTLTAATPARYVWPAGSDKRDAEGAGPFSDSNYFNLGTGADVLDFAGDFTRCTVVNVTSCATAPIIDIDGAAGSGGYYLALNTSCVPIFTTASGAGQLTQTSGVAVSLSGPSIVCYGRASGQGFIAVDGATAVTSAARTTQDTTNPARTGVLNDGTLALAGGVSEQWASATAFSTANVARIQQSWLAHQGDTRQPMTVTRTTEATSVVDGKLYRHPAGTLRSTPNGKLYEGQVVNKAQYSEQFDQSGAGLWVAMFDTTAVVVTADQTTGMDGATTADKLVVPVVTGTQYSAICQPFTATAAAWDASVWIKTLTGTSAPHFYFWDGGGTYHTTTCAATTTYAPCEVTATLTAATWQLCLGHDRNDGAQTTTGAETFYVWGAQAELGSFPHQYCGPTLNATRTCNADVVTVVNPLRPPGTDWTNLALQSEDFATTWIAEAGVSVIANSPLCPVAPDGSMTADLVTGFSNGKGIYESAVGTGSGAVHSMWIAAANGDAPCTLTITDANTGTGSTAITTASGFARSFAVISGGAGHGPYLTNSSQTCTRACVWGAQTEIGSGTTPSPYCPTGAAAATCSNGGATGKVVTNVAKNSENFAGASWTCVSTVGTNAATAPDGTLTAESLTKVNVGDADNNYQLVTLAGAGTLDVYLKNSNATTATLADNSGSHTCTLTFATGTAVGAGAGTTCAAAALTDGWFRVVLGVPSNPTLLNIRHDVANAQGTVFYAWGAQAENATFAGPYCGPTGAAGKTCGPKQSWCVRVRDVTPESGVAWSVGTRGFWEVGPAAASINSLSLYDATGNVYLDTVDRTGDQKYISVVLGTASTIIGCSNDGVLSLCVDGICSTPTATGTGTALMSQWSASVIIGDLYGGGYSLNGTLGSIDFNNSGNPLDFAP